MNENTLRIRAIDRRKANKLILASQKKFKDSQKRFNFVVNALSLLAITTGVVLGSVLVANVSSIVVAFLIK